MRYLTIIITLAIATQAHAEPIDPTDIRVIDGDTIRVYHQQPNVRLVGFNAPETRNAACDAEAGLGAKATRRLRDLIRAGNLEFQYVRCSAGSPVKFIVSVMPEAARSPSTSRPAKRRTVKATTR